MNPLPDTVYIVYIAATPQQVWDGLTQSAFTKQYFGFCSMESDWRAGSDWKLLMPDGGVNSYGKVLESDSPRHLLFSWKVECMPELRQLPECFVCYEIQDMGGVVKLTMTESHPHPIDPKYLEGGKQGWPMILSGLKSLLETGKPLPKFEMPPPKFE